MKMIFLWDYWADQSVFVESIKFSKRRCLMLTNWLVPIGQHSKSKNLICINNNCYITATMDHQSPNTISTFTLIPFTQCKLIGKEWTVTVMKSTTFLNLTRYEAVNQYILQFDYDTVSNTMYIVPYFDNGRRSVSQHVQHMGNILQ